ncbi:hypothetical protein [Actinophytocola sp.]|uniref:hypothetical protein n=1 Tax=Actinophytocola sp. TaxID=1872138 RepID=UPI003D6B634C
MSSVEEIRANRPPEVGVARVLLIIAVVSWLPIVLQLYGPTGGLASVAMFFAVYGSFGAVKGRQAGRLMTTIALAAAVLLMLPYCWLGFRDDENPYGFVYATVDIAAVLLAAVAVGLLYHPNSNRYVHLVTVARQAS